MFEYNTKSDWETLQFIVKILASALPFKLLARSSNVQYADSKWQVFSCLVV